MAYAIHGLVGPWRAVIDTQGRDDNHQSKKSQRANRRRRIPPGVQEEDEDVDVGDGSLRGDT